LLCVNWFLWGTAQNGVVGAAAAAAAARRALTHVLQVYWMPLCLKSLPGVTADSVGLLAALIYAAAMVGMGVCARWSDGSGRHAQCLAACMGVACVGFGGVAVALQQQAAVAVVVCAFCVVACGLWGVMGPFWGVVPLQFSKAEAAVGIALVNSMGVAGSFLGPLLVAALVGGTNKFVSAFAVSSALAAASAAAAVALACVSQAQPRRVQDV
jgi:ACS family tartrate transporter-like MFS transporter